MRSKKEIDPKRIEVLEKEIAKLNKQITILQKPTITVKESPKYTHGKVVDTYWCYFLLGSNRAYNTDTLISLEEVLKHISNFQSKYWKDALSVNVVPNNTIVFKDYKEACYNISAINYPRFPKNQREIYEFMITLAEYLLVNLEQQRITLVTPEKSVMLENVQLIDKTAGSFSK